MKKQNNIEDELDIIREKMQKEMEEMGTKAWTAKLNKEAEELAKEYGFNFKIKSDKTVDKKINK